MENLKNPTNNQDNRNLAPYKMDELDEPCTSYKKLFKQINIHLKSEVRYYEERLANAKDAVIYYKEMYKQVKRYRKNVGK